MTDSCQQLRRALIKRGFINARGEIEMTGQGTWETKACATPLFAEAERKAGLCRSCSSGWTHPENYPIHVEEPSPVSDMARAYIACALWSSTDDSDEGGGEPMDSVYSIDDLAPACLATMIEEADSFYAEHAELLATCGASAERVGHDYWLTRNGHGAGFWDRGDDSYPKAARDILTESAGIYGSRDLYIGDDGLIYQS